MGRVCYNRQTSHLDVFRVEMLNQNPRQADFVLGTCPSCQKVVRIPVTAMTSQSKSQVKCPICSSSFEIADILEEMIPSVEVVDDTTEHETAIPQQDIPPERINAIDTPELFHVAKDNYQPKTEKKNGRFVVPELLSKGIKKKKKRSRKKSRSPEEKKLVEQSLAKLKETTKSHSLSQNERTENRRRPDSEKHQSRSSRRRSSRDGRSRVPEKSTPSNNIKRKVRSGYSSFLSKLGKPDSKLEYIMIGIGALFAIPVLHMMMWWFVGVDPLGLAKPTSYVVPFVVPNELKAKTDAGQELDDAPVLMKREPKVIESPESIFESKDGKLPRPKLDPDSVHVGN